MKKILTIYFILAGCFFLLLSFTNRAITYGQDDEFISEVTNNDDEIVQPVVPLPIEEEEKNIPEPPEEEENYD